MNLVAQWLLTSSEKSIKIVSRFKLDKTMCTLWHTGLQFYGKNLQFLWQFKAELCSALKALWQLHKHSQTLEYTEQWAIWLHILSKWIEIAPCILLKWGLIWGFGMVKMEGASDRERRLFLNHSSQKDLEEGFEDLINSCLWLSLWET